MRYVKVSNLTRCGDCFLLVVMLFTNRDEIVGPHLVIMRGRGAANAFGVCSVARVLLRMVGLGGRL